MFIAAVRDGRELEAFRVPLAVGGLGTGEYTLGGVHMA